MFNFFRKSVPISSTFSSKLYDEKSFYSAFIGDLVKAKKEVIIESPFITSKRMDILQSVLKKLVGRNVKVYVMTRHPNLHREKYAYQSEQLFVGLKRLVCYCSYK